MNEEKVGGEGGENETSHLAIRIIIFALLPFPVLERKNQNAQYLLKAAPHLIEK